MNVKIIAEWRGWIWIAIFLFVTQVGAAFTLYANTEQYTDRRVSELRAQVCTDLQLLRQDVRTIHEDIKLLLRSYKP